MLVDQAPWYAIGPGVGLVLVGMLAFVNVRMGVLGGVTDFVERAGGRSQALGWKGWFLVGIIAGGLLFRVLAGAATTGGDRLWLAVVRVRRGRPADRPRAAVRGPADRLRRQARRRLHVGQRSQRRVVRLSRERRRHGHIHGHRHRREPGDRGARMTSAKAVSAGFGVVFGFLLSWGQLTDPAVIQEMLRLESAYVFLVMGSGIAVGFTGVRLLRRASFRAVLNGELVSWPTERPQPRHVVGSVLFGLGWALSDACPGPIAAQLGQGSRLVGVHGRRRGGRCGALPVAADRGLARLAQRGSPGGEHPPAGGLAPPPVYARPSEGLMVVSSSLPSDPTTSRASLRHPWRARAASGRSTGSWRRTRTPAVAAGIAGTVARSGSPSSRSFGCTWTAIACASRRDLRRRAGIEGS